MDGTSLVNPNVYVTVVILAAIDGEAVLFAAYQSHLLKAMSPAEDYRYLYALTEFRNLTLVERGLELLLSSEMRNQDAPHYLSAFYRVADSQTQAWEFTKNRWSDLQHQWTTWGGGTVVNGTHNFCDAKLRNDVTQFFGTHNVAASERGLKQSLER